jgi:hypothetical protein
MRASYLQNYSPVPISYWASKEEEHKGLDPDSSYLITHVELCQAIQRKRVLEAGGVPIPSATIHTHLPNASLAEISEFVDVTGYSKAAGRARHFRLKPDYAERRMKARRLTAEEFYTSPKVNYFTGKAAKQRVRGRKHDESGNLEPELVRRTIEFLGSLRPSFNWREVDEHIHRLWIEAEAVKGQFGIGSYEYESSRGRLMSDVYSRDAVLAQGVEIYGDFLAFEPAYRAISTGRLHHIGGGLQGCSRTMKRAAYKGVEGIHNWDLKNAHFSIALQIAERAGINPRPIIDYLSANRSQLADEIGMDEATLKNCVIALLFGANIPKPNSSFKVRRNSIINKLRIACNGDEDRMRAALYNFRAAVGPLAEVVDQIMEYHITDWLAGNIVGGRWVKNATGKTKSVADIRGYGQHLGRKRLTAFIIQGIEAAFTHNLTLLSSKYDFSVFSSEHDGLVTQGCIPKEAVEKASRLSGFVYADLREKPF